MEFKIDLNIFDYKNSTIKQFAKKLEEIYSKNKNEIGIIPKYMVINKLGMTSPMKHWKRDLLLKSVKDNEKKVLAVEALFSHMEQCLLTEMSNVQFYNKNTRYYNGLEKILFSQYGGRYREFEIENQNDNDKPIININLKKSGKL